ncbi:hypothetical protein UA75_30185 [Actinoalloteichus sp. GBA129-24]|uniref:Uncharacterized protein n=1 Tax=Actinoalloteichus fjordicus TaxID=1612552 RepID=A0AAC9LHK2_9PSEU|nr:hypothetical protein UA74_29655 [Actinoalloteichus fjordicus]APU24001.1 hypothetical protein UA75_30185 [Actinoalloteichus sp. GBA129-24]
MGVSPDHVIDLIFDLIENHVPVGQSGKDGAVYETEVNGEVRPICVVVGSNGYIVTAYPIGRKAKFKRYRERG